MEPSSIQGILLQAIYDQLPSYLNDWRYISTSFYTLPEPEIQEFLCTLLHRYGFTTQKLSQNPQVIYAEYAANASQTVLFSMPYHTITSLQQAQRLVLPFVAQLTALQIYQTRLGHLPINLKWLFTKQDILNHTTFTRIMTDHRPLLQADACILYTTAQEISQEMAIPELSLGIKGQLQVELSTRTAQREISADYGAIATNAAWQLVWGLQSIKNSHEDVLLEGFYDALIPPEDEAIASIAQLPDTTSMLTQRWGTEQLLLGLHGVQQRYAHFLTPTCTITEFHSHLSANEAKNPITIPATASAQLDFKLVPDQSPYTIFTALQQHLIPYTVQARLLRASSPAYTSIKKPLAKHVYNSLHIAYQQVPVLLPLSTETDPYEQIIRNQLSIPTLRIALPLAETPDQHEQQLTQSIHHQTLFCANIAHAQCS